MKPLKFLIIFIIIFSIYNAQAQIENHKNDFCFPLKITPSLSGNFGEPRSRHFHAGIDFRTYTENKQVVSVEDGYISRVSVSPWGYGLAIYINHPSGYTSVYGHLSKFKPEVQNFVRKIQYESNTFRIDTIVPENMFPVRKNELIGYSGNTGQSEGPHLHFEIRETISDISINTLGTVYNIRDNIRPELYSVAIYPLSDSSAVDGKNKKKLYQLVSNQNGTYTLANGLVPKATGQIGIGISYIDRMNDTPNRFGAESVKLFVDDSLIYYSSMTTVDFAKQKCKNSVFDYSYYIEKNLHMQKAFVEPNNDLEIFPNLVNNGLINIKSGETKKINIEIKDFNGNKSFSTFNIKGDAMDYILENSGNIKIKWDDYNTLLSRSFRVDIDSASLFYDNIINIKKTGEKKYSDSYKVGEDGIALKKDIVVSFFVSEKLSDYKNKIVVSRVFNKRKTALKVEYHQNFVSAASGSFGEFYLEVDTVPPRITPQNIFNGANLTNNLFIEIKIEDNLSDIAKYDLYINDRWVLGQYEPKLKSVRYFFDEYFPVSDKYDFKAIVSDNCGNEATYSCSFFR